MVEAAQRAQATAAKAAAKAAQLLAEAGMCDHRLQGGQPGGPSQASCGTAGGGYAYHAGAAVAAMENALGSGGGSWQSGGQQRAGCGAPGHAQGAQSGYGAGGGGCPSPGGFGLGIGGGYRRGAQHGLDGYDVGGVDGGPMAGGGTLASIMTELRPADSLA